MCRAWNKILGDLSQENFGWIPKLYRYAHILYWDTRTKHAAFQFTEDAYEFSNRDKFQQFVHKFEDSTSNPFFGKTVFLNFSSRDINDPREFHHTTVNFMDFFSTYISNCEIYLDQYNRAGLEQKYQDLMDLLWAMPNARKLRIGEIESINDEFLENVRIPPTLEKLQSLEFHNVCPSICNAILKSNLQIYSLCVQDMSKDKQDYLVYPYENLEHLALQRYDWNTLCYFGDSSIKWKLETLWLNGYNNARESNISWPELLNLLSEKFGSTLKCLELGLPEITDKEQMSKLVDNMLQYRLHFPKLKILYLRLPHFTPLDFLLGISETLEVIHISLIELSYNERPENLRKVKSVETAKVWSCFCKYCMSKFFNLFPNLKTFTFTSSCCYYHFYRNKLNDHFVARINSKIMLNTCYKLRWLIEYFYETLHYKRVDDNYECDTI